MTDIKIITDRAVVLSVAPSRFATRWTGQTMTTAQLAERLSRPVVGTETHAEYMSMSKADQDRLKDVGGYVAGSLKDGRRKADAVIGRDLVTLDLDHVPPYGTQDVIDRLDSLGFGYMVYSTRKHTPARPRLRVLITLDRTVSADEYEPIARMCGKWIGIEMADPTTYQAVRLMYWPSCSRDAEYVFHRAEKPFLSADGTLGLYRDWHDVREWPAMPGEGVLRAMAARAGDPTTKQGIVGTFCRTYDIVQAAERFLPGVYAEAGPGRLTYCSGSTSGGAVIYDDGRFLYSHHATDPCSCRLVNAFDLVRLHRFGDLDDDAAPGTPVNRLPSYGEMCRLAVSDEAVSRAVLRERQERAGQDFEDLPSEACGDPSEAPGGRPEGAGSADPAGDVWMGLLTRNPTTGQLAQTSENVRLVLENDRRLGPDHVAQNDFAGRLEVLGSLPWNPEDRRRPWSDVDTSGLYCYLETVWGLTRRTVIDAALDVYSVAHRFNEVQDYLRGLKWDGVPRLDTLLCEYLGAPNNTYTTSVTRKALVGAVARALDPGCKYDTMLILVGPQGIGKSTLLDRMSRGWYNDSIRTFEGKEAAELIKGVWIVEIAELDAMRRTEVSRVKQFLSLRCDRYRAAYGKRVSEQPRTCAFFGTCNESEFLTDTTGNRRFWPVDVPGAGEDGKSVFTDLTADVIDQVWAEAVVRYRQHEPLYLTGEAVGLAQERQEAHRVTDMWEPAITEFVERKVPRDWTKWDIDRRRTWWSTAYLHNTSGSSGVTPSGEELVARDRICAAEVWVELFGRAIVDARPADTRAINATLSRMRGWSRPAGAIWAGPYGNQRGFKRD